MNKVRGIGLLTALLVFLIDQGVKYLVTHRLGLAFDIDSQLNVLPIFDVRLVQNSGVSLGLLRAGTEVSRWALVGFTALIAAGVVWWMLRERKQADVVLLGAVLGGALGNILDRSRLGYVVDFADLHFGGWHPFLVFNVADAAITIGVVILLIRALFVRDRPVATPELEQGPVEKNVNA